MSGIQIPESRPKGRAEFWKREPVATPAEAPVVVPEPVPVPVLPAAPMSAPMSAPVELRVELAPGVSISIAVSDDIALSTADVRAIRAAAAPLMAELARCRLAANAGGDEP
jgi:hypothetical protein